jgi:pyruvate formate lyase activating enzyme
VVRGWYTIEHYRISSTGRCEECGSPVAGVFSGAAGSWGSRRLPVSIDGPPP